MRFFNCYLGRIFQAATLYFSLNASAFIIALSFLLCVLIEILHDEYISNV